MQPRRHKIQGTAIHSSSSCDISKYGRCGRLAFHRFFFPKSFNREIKIVFGEGIQTALISMILRNQCLSDEVPIFLSLSIF